MDKVSVIVPVFKTECYIYQCINSILNQSYKNLEIILVDDESPDRCPEICDEFKKLDNRIKVVHKKNSGLGLTRNAGLREASGRYVTFIDSDDWMDNNHILNLVKGMNEGKCDLSIGSFKKVLQNEKVQEEVKLYKSGIYTERSDIEETALDMIAPGSRSGNELSIPMSVCFNMYKLEIINLNNLEFMSERICVGEDLFFNIEYINNCKSINFVDVYGYNYRYNPESITHVFNPERISRTFEYYNILKKKVKELGINAGIRIERSTLSKLRVAICLICSSNYRYKEKKYYIYQILNHDIMDEILSNYPLSSYRFSVCVATFFMKHKATIPVYIIFSLKNIAQKRKK